MEWAKKCVAEKLDCNRNDFVLSFKTNTLGSNLRIEKYARILLPQRYSKSQGLLNCGNKNEIMINLIIMFDLILPLLFLLLSLISYQVATWAYLITNSIELLWYII